MKKLVNKQLFRFALSVLACMFMCVGNAWAQTKQYHVTLNANSGWFYDGSSEDKVLDIDENEPFGVLPTPTRTGYAFAGWYKVPGQETSRVTPEKKYQNAIFGEMLHARWTKKYLTLVFMSFDGTTEIGRMSISAESGSTLADIPADTYYPKPDGQDTPDGFYLNEDEYFAGYYTQTNGGGQRAYKGVILEDRIAGTKVLSPVGYTIPETAKAGSTVYLYAFKTHVKHTVHWDYSYFNGRDSESKDIWVNLQEGDTEGRIQYGKLTFMNSAGTPLKYIYFQAAPVANKAVAEMTTDLTTHTTTQGQFHLQATDDPSLLTPNGKIVTGTTPAVNGNAGIWNVYFTDEELSQFTRYDFQPIHDGKHIYPSSSYDHEASAENWNCAIDRAAHETWFTYTGAGDAGNVAQLPWTVTLKGLQVYPDYVIAKPLFDQTPTAGTRSWEEISQLAALDGVHCYETSRTTEGGNVTSVTYSGHYPVWKQGGSTSYDYAIGMVGFEIYGQMVYLNHSNPGKFSTAFNSANSTHSEDFDAENNPPLWDNRTSQWDNENKVFPAIHYTISEDEIPVVRFMTDPEKNETRAVGTPIILFGTNNETVPNFGTKYYAIRPGCTFLGWSVNPTATVPDSDMGLDKTFTFIGAKTVYPVWQDDVAPIITPDEEVACAHNVNVTVTDNVEVKTVTVKIGDVVQEDITVTGLNTMYATLTLPAPTDGSVTYTIDASDGTLNAEQKTVTIYANHDIKLKAAKDPTNTEDGLFEGHYHCANCGKYFQDDRTTELTPEQLHDHIIPAGYVLIKTKEGSVAYTKRWYSNLNDAIDHVGSGSETGTYIKLTDNTVVTGNAFHTPSVPAELNLNGFGLVGEDGTAKDITGNSDVTILLIDGNNIGNAADSDDRYYKDGQDLYSELGGVLDYANYSKVTDSPVKYTRTFTKTQAAVWQGLFLPINAGVISGCDFGTAAGVALNSEKTSGTLKIKKGVSTLNAFTSYFIRANDSAVKSIEIMAKENVLYPCDDEDESVTTGVKIGESNFYIAGALNKMSNHQTSVDKAFWTITNAGYLNWVDSNKDARQRPYRWVIFDKDPSTGDINAAKPLFSTFSIVESEATAINDVESTNKDANSPVYNMNGMRMNNNANLAPGLYIRGGKKFIVK